MANIILTLIDSKNGVASTSYSFKDEDIEKIYVAYRHSMSPPSDDPDYEQPNITPKDISDRIYEELMNSVTSFVHAEQIKIACEELNIQPIKATGSP